MAVGLFSGAPGLNLGTGLNRLVAGLWSGASGLATGFAGFSPISLFAASEPGFWYDPSDLTTLFQDSAGATPVTTAGQSVGLVLDKRLGLTRTTAQGTVPPQTLGWTSSYPFAATLTGGGSTTLNPQSLVNSGVWTGTIYYVDPTTGSNTNSGLTPALALQTIQAAVNLGQAGGVPFRVYPTAGLYPRNRAPVVIPASCPDFAIIPQGGRCTFTTHDALTWTNDGSGTNTYTATRGSTMRVLDMTNLSSRGLYTDLTRLTDGDVAGVRATAGTWCQNGTSLVVHRVDNAAPTNSNTRAYVSSDLFTAGTNNTSVYIENVDFEGGNAFYIAGGTRNIALKSSTCRYVGSSAALYDSYRITNMAGVFYAEACDGSAACKDGFNFTTSSGTGMIYGLLVRCTGYENGRYTSNSNNGLTAHQTYHRIVDVGGNYADNNDGDNVAFVGGSKLWAFDTVGGLTPTAGRYSFLADGSGTEMWLEQTQALDALSIASSNSAAVYKMNATSAGSEVTLTGGTIGSFLPTVLPGNHAAQSTALSRPTYQVDSSGRGHLLFDGSDDFLATPTITPGTNKAQIFAGVRKLSDAAQASILSLGNITQSGGLEFFAPTAASANDFNFVANGGTAFVQASAGSRASPITVVAVGVIDLSLATGDVTNRINGAVAKVSTGDAGSANLRTDTVYVGRRAGATLPFNGRIYSLIGRFGVNLTSPQIAQTEAWVNSKTGAY